MHEITAHLLISIGGQASPSVCGFQPPKIGFAGDGAVIWKRSTVAHCNELRAIPSSTLSIKSFGTLVASKTLGASTRHLFDDFWGVEVSEEEL